MIVLLAIVEYRILNRRAEMVSAMTGRPRVRWSTVLLSVLAVVWLYPLVVDVDQCDQVERRHLPRSVGHSVAAGDRQHRRGMEPGQLAHALANSAYVTAMTVAIVIVLAVLGAYALTRLRPPARAMLFLVILAPLMIPTEVLIVPLFSMYRALGLINSLPGLAMTNVVASVSFATVILAGYFRTIPQDLIDAARVDGAGRVEILLRIVVPLARPGIAAVAVLVAVFTWNDFAGALVLIQTTRHVHRAARPDAILDLLRNRPGPHVRRDGDRDPSAAAPLRGAWTQLHPGVGDRDGSTLILAGSEPGSAYGRLATTAQL